MADETNLGNIRPPSPGTTGKNNKSKDPIGCGSIVPFSQYPYQIEFDKNWKRLRANQKYLDDIGETLDQWLSGDSLTLVHPDDLKVTERKRREVTRTKRTDSFEFRHRFKNGYRWMHWYYVPFLDKNGKIESFCCEGRPFVKRGYDRRSDSRESPPQIEKKKKMKPH